MEYTNGYIRCDYCGEIMSRSNAYQVISETGESSDACEECYEAVTEYQEQRSYLNRKGRLFHD